VTAADAAGNTGVATLTAILDTVAPDTTITTSPATVTSGTGATFGFSATETGVTFQCKLDGDAFGPCTSPRSYSGLSAGAHTFQVRATDLAGNGDPTPARFKWRVRTKAPPV